MYNAFDLLFFLGSLVAVIAIGFWSGRRQEASVSGYFRGGNRLPWYAIGFSIIAAGISSEQFVGEMGYAYKLGMPVVNWEWLVFPALSILLWIFVPLYVRNHITTMPEYLEGRFGPQARMLYAYLTVASYVFVNFALVFYTGAFALEKMWGIDKLWAVWLLAGFTGLYTVYGGLSAVAWTSSLQCILLMGGGIYVFFAGMAAAGWDFQAVVGTGQRASLMTPADHPEIPWTAFVILALSTNVWYYATNQYINQRCLAAKNEWHAKMGVLLAGGLQVLMPLATCFPAMVYYAVNPHLEDSNAAYPVLVAAFVPTGLKGLVAAAIVGAIMSTISGLVNSTSTIITLDIVQRGVGRGWPEERLVAVGRWSGGIALLIGALFAPVVMKWESLFRYAQDIWAPMAAPVVVVFLCGALWKSAGRRGAIACLWMAILTVPFTLAKSILADAGIHFLRRNLETPQFLANAGIQFQLSNLENPLVLAGAVSLASWALMLALRDGWPWWLGWGLALPLCAATAAVAVFSPVATAILVCAVMAVATIAPALGRSTVIRGMWDQSMLLTEPKVSIFANLWLWWFLFAISLGGLYYWFW